MNIPRMNSEQSAPRLQPILTEQQKLEAKHSVYVIALQCKFPEDYLVGHIKDTKKTFPNLRMLSELEDYIAGKRQLLNLLSPEHEVDFYQILSEQIELSQAHYLNLYKKFSLL